DADPLYTRHSGSGAGPASPASGKCAAVIIRRDVRPESSQDRCIGFRRFSVDGNGFCTYIGEILYVIGGLKVWKQQKSVNHLAFMYVRLVSHSSVLHSIQ